MRFGEQLQESDLEKLRGLIKRRGEGEPLQHLLGSVEFCGVELVCDHRALVPRPETERLVELLIEKFGDQPPATVLDVGTGSGCIGLSLAKAWADASGSFSLIDISEDALELARLNASRLGLNGASIRFVRSDLFEKIDGAFDLIVANLPYIPRAEIPTLSPEVRRDPLLALDGGVVGTEIIERFINDCQARLASGGWIALEIGLDQVPPVASLCEAAGMTEIKAEKDLASIERFVFARRA